MQRKKSFKKVIIRTKKIQNKFDIAIAIGTFPKNVTKSKDE